MEFLTLLYGLFAESIVERLQRTVQAMSQAPLAIEVSDLCRVIRGLAAAIGSHFKLTRLNEED